MRRRVINANILCGLLLPVFSTGLHSGELPRRELFQSIVGTSIAATAALQQPAAADTAATSYNDDVTSKHLAAYKVIPDSGPKLNPTLESFNSDTLFQQLSSQKGGGALWLGEHHNSAKDHAMQEQILCHLHQARLRNGSGGRGAADPSMIAVGLEQVEVQFQPVLDDFSKGLLSTAELRKQVEWDTRWTWPFELYEPVFARARDYGMPLVALNVNTEDLVFVETSGLPGLPKDRMRAYIADTAGFAQFATTREFSTYVDYVIRPSYDMHQALGLLQYSRSGRRLDEAMSFRNFFSGRILWDEAMASRAAAWTRTHPGGLMVGLVGADHVKFRNGIPGRFARLVAGQPEVTCTSILLNPTMIDTRPSGTVGMEGADSSRPDSITLQLRYLKDDIDRNSPERTLASSTGGVLPLADYLLIG